MSYVVLARKYRPRSFQQMVGQEAVVRALSSALSTGRLHHAYLFTGTRGIGKTTVSRILAKSLNCTGPDGQGGITAEPCGQCSACREIDADRFVDYVELDAASNRSIDEVRDLLERAAYKPAVGRFKVFMIDEAHQLTKDAFNALLKTLEEPPDYLKFVLATTDPQKMLPTVLSRCLQFNLRPIAPSVVEAHLQDVLSREGVPFEDQALTLLGQAARGSMRDALSLTDQAIAYGQGRLEAQAVRAMIGLAGPGHVIELLQALAAHDAPRIHAAVVELRDSGQSAVAAVESMTQALQSIALEQAIAGSLATEDDAPWRALASAWDPREVQLLYSMFVAGRNELGLAPDEHAALQMIAWRFLAFAGVPAGAHATSPAAGAAAARPLMVSPSRPARATAQPSKPEQPLPSPQPDPLPEPPALRADPSPTVTDRSADSDAWFTLAASLIEARAVGGLVRELVLQSQGRPGGPGCDWELRVPRDSLATPALADKLAQAMAEHSGQPRPVLRVSIGEVADSLAIRETQAKRARQEQAEATIRTDPLVVDLLERFPGARLVQGSVRPQSNHTEQKS